MPDTALPTVTQTAEAQQYFLQSASASLATVRSVLLIAAQMGDPSNIIPALRTVARIGSDAVALGFSEIAVLSTHCESQIKQLASLDHCSSNNTFAALDMVARIEAALWNVPPRAQEFLPDVSQFVESSFGDLTPGSATHAESFDIDDETMEIFRSEAMNLLANMAAALESMSRNPGDQNAIWDLRRHAHTFKGAAGIVGLRSASETAHQMEDLLSGLAEKQHAAAPEAGEFLIASARRLDLIVNAERFEDVPTELNDQYERVMKWLASPQASLNDDSRQTAKAESNGGSAKSTTTPILRVSVERLDEIIGLSQTIAANWSKASELDAAASFRMPEMLGSIIARQQTLTDELQAKLLQIRMVRFGTLKTRLSRTIHATCLDEKKKAVLEIENGEAEIDTLVIDAIIEPLLHLVKNAVVHGIEAPDTRRFLGKNETGLIKICIEADRESLMLSVSDDGAGISILRLKEKALSSGVVDDVTAASMDDLAAIDLIFDRGLTTADKIDLNAGRGVGMSIVKESVEGRGGTVLVESAPQQGTTFTILMPLTRPMGNTALREQQADRRNMSAPPLVMIVDDSASMRHLTSKLVKGAGYRVHAANDGVEAVELLLTGQCEPDLILSDVEMSQIDGWELLRCVKTNVNLSNIPVVLVTSLDAEQHRRKAFELGAFDYIVKPFKSDHLNAILKNLPSFAAA